jgi:hypothetical protein
MTEPRHTRCDVAVTLRRDVALHHCTPASAVAAIPNGRSIERHSYVTTERDGYEEIRPQPTNTSRPLAGLLILLFAFSSLADEKRDQAAVESARESLGGYNEFPWYDAEKDSIRRVDVTPPADVEGRKSKWETKPINWSFPDWLGHLLEAFGWLILALAIALVVYALVRAFGVSDWFSPAGGAADSDVDSLHGDIDRVESLPFQLQRPQSDLLSEARRQYEAGNYGQAMIYLYSYQLVELDRHHLIRLAKGKTNRQYLRELRQRQRHELWSVLHGSMITFEDVFFGHHVLNRTRFEDCWHKLNEFQQQLELVAA